MGRGRSTANDMNVRRLVSAALVERGYVRDDRMHLLRVDTERSWVVDTGPLGGKRTDIAPFVGIRVESLEKMTAELLQVPAGESNASVGANVGYVLGLGYKTYIPPTAVAHVISAIDAAQERLKPYFSLAELPEIWKMTGVYDPGWQYRDITIKLLTGRYAVVPHSLEEARKEFCQFDDEVCEQFRGFERNVRKRLV
jgi:hypothetical protein